MLERVPSTFTPLHMEDFDLTQPKVSVALIRLRNRGMVESFRRAGIHYWRRVTDASHSP